MEKYENIELVPEDIEVLQDLEKKFGVPIPHIEKIIWEDVKIDEDTHHVTKFKQHQFGFVSENNHVVELGLSFNNVNESKIGIPSVAPKFSGLKKLRVLDINGWGKAFSAYLDEYNKRQEAYNKTMYNTMFRNMDERRKAQDDARRALYQYIPGVNFNDVYLEIKKLESLEVLDVSDCRLEHVGFLKDLSKLKYLDISHNSIEKFSDNLEVLDNLEQILIENNPLKIFPAELQKAINLKVLNLSDTNIKEIPEFVSEFQKLEEFYLPLQIVGFPQSIIHLKKLKTLVSNQFPEHFKELTTLEQLIISSSKDEELHEGLANITNLKQLVINNCRTLKKLPNSIGSLQNLKELIITGNLSLEEIPLSIFSLKNLKSLNLFNNNLKKFPDKLGDLPYLEILTLSNNKLEHLPYSIFKLNNLIDFSIENNPLELNDKLISAKTLPEIKEYSKKKMAINVFISHAVADFEPCRLEELSAYLENQLEVDIAFICERDLSGNIDGFMDKNVPKSQLLLFIATERSVNSVDCQYELKLARDYSVQILPIKAKALDWGDLAKIGLNRELGMECDFKDVDKFNSFCADLYKYIKQLKRQIDLHDKEQGKIDRLTVGLKIAERKIEEMSKILEKITQKLQID